MKKSNKNKENPLKMAMILGCIAMAVFFLTSIGLKYPRYEIISHLMIVIVLLVFGQQFLIWLLIFTWIFYEKLVGLAEKANLIMPVLSLIRKSV